MNRNTANPPFSAVVEPLSGLAGTVDRLGFAASERRLL